MRDFSKPIEIPVDPIREVRWWKDPKKKLSEVFAEACHMYDSGQLDEAGLLEILKNKRRSGKTFMAVQCALWRSIQGLSSTILVTDSQQVELVLKCLQDHVERSYPDKRVTFSLFDHSFILRINDKACGLIRVETYKRGFGLGLGIEDFVIDDRYDTQPEAPVERGRPIVRYISSLDLLLQNTKDR